MAYDTSPIPQGYGSLPIQTRTGNPYLDEIDQAAGNAHASLSPGAQEALKRAGAPVGIQAQQQPQGIQNPPTRAIPTLGPQAASPAMPEAQPSTQPLASSVPTAPTTGIVAPHQQVQPVPQTAAAGPAQAEMTRLAGSKAGVDQIHNPWGRIPLQILAGIGETFAPRLAQALPGTQSHHNMLLGQAENAVEQQQGIRKSEEEARAEATKTGLEEAQAGEVALRPELREAQNELKSRGLDITQAKNEATAAAAQTAVDQKIRASGYDPKTGEPLPYEQLSEQQQAVHDWRAAQAEERQATALLRRAQAENQPEMLRLAQQKLASAQNNRSTAERRLELSREQFEFRSQGTINGVAPEGTLLSESGKPVGTANALNVRPTGTERNRGDLAASAHEQLRDMRDIVNRHPEFFGPGAGRAQEFQNWIGSEDPDAKRFATARTILAEHGSGVFGARSAAAASAQKIASGEWKDNPAAIQGALDQIEKAMTTIGGRGTPRTVGGNQGNQNNAPAKTYTQANVDAAVKAGNGTAQEIEAAFKAKGYQKQ